MPEAQQVLLGTPRRRKTHDRSGRGIARMKYFCTRRSGNRSSVTVRSKGLRARILRERQKVHRNNSIVPIHRINVFRIINVIRWRQNDNLMRANIFDFPWTNNETRMWWRRPDFRALQTTFLWTARDWKSIGVSCWFQTKLWPSNRLRPIWFFGDVYERFHRGPVGVISKSVLSTVVSSTRPFPRPVHTRIQGWERGNGVRCMCRARNFVRYRTRPGTVRRDDCAPTTAVFFGAARTVRVVRRPF